MAAGLMAGCGPYHGTPPSSAAVTGSVTYRERSALPPDAVAGNGSCNRFFGTVSIDGNAMSIRPLGTTRMACTEAVAMQEVSYMRALQSAERYVLQGASLLIYIKGMQSPLRFVTAP
jgi:heat shock protein HslJ